MLTAVDYYNS